MHVGIRRIPAHSGHVDKPFQGYGFLQAAAGDIESFPIRVKFKAMDHKDASLSAAKVNIELRAVWSPAFSDVTTVKLVGMIEKSITVSRGDGEAVINLEVPATGSGWIAAIAEGPKSKSHTTPVYVITSGEARPWIRSRAGVQLKWMESMLAEIKSSYAAGRDMSYWGYNAKPLMTKNWPGILQRIAFTQKVVDSLRVMLNDPISLTGEYNTGKSRGFSIKPSALMRGPKVNVTLTSLGEGGNYSIFNLRGELIRRLSSSNSRQPVQWNLRDAHGNVVKPGLYLIILIDRTGRSFTRTLHILDS